MPPIIIIGFNRPDKLTQLISALKCAEVSNLYFSFDGPRDEFMEKDSSSIKECIAIAESVDHPKKVIRSHDSNLGCRDHVINAISWFFTQEAEGIILEDDCIPDESFTKFCEELLAYYREDDRVIMVSGNNFGNNHLVDSESYSFSKYISIWGWATWSHEWQRFLSFFEEMKTIDENGIESVGDSICAWLMNKEEGDHRFSMFKKSMTKEIDSWGLILSAYALSHGLMTVIPRQNLISNIGFDERGTHTRNATDPNAELNTYSMEFPLSHPNHMRMSYDFHRSYGNRPQRDTSLLRKLKNRFQS